MSTRRQDIAVRPCVKVGPRRYQRSWSLEVDGITVAEYSTI